jgi:protein-S-isoprenylcysteine O-methyltransferase Ste14
MQAFYNWFFPALWIAYLIYWQIAAAGAKATTRIESLPSRITRSIVFLVAIALFFVPPHSIPFIDRHFLSPALWTFWLGAAVTLAGLLFAIWARVTIGSNWSRSVTIKQNHELITTGPYHFVRHPIYTGLLTAFAGSAFATTEVRGILAFLLVFLSLGYKLRLEERFMRSQFGETYIDYSRRTAALVPWLL